MLLLVTLRCVYVLARFSLNTRHLVEVLTDHHNLQRLMTTKSLIGWLASWWEMLSGYNVNIVYKGDKNNPANTSSHRLDYTKALKGCCAATILTAHCNTKFCLW
jgi:hypothetical protein